VQGLDEDEYFLVPRSADTALEFHGVQGLGDGAYPAFFLLVGRFGRLTRQPIHGIAG
jgi:hypothetical protein